MNESYLMRLRRGASSMLKGISHVYKDKDVRRTYRFILLALVVLSIVINLGGGYAVWKFSEPDGDASTWLVWGLLLLRILGWFAVLLVSPFVAITACNLLFPVFSEIPFFAGLKSLDARRGTSLEARPGLGNATAILNSLRRFLAFLVATTGCFLLGLVPFVGPFVAPPLQFYLTARAIGWEMMDPYFDRAGIPWDDQKKIIRKHSAEFLGMGLICAPLLSLPVVGPFLFGLVQAGSAQFVIDVFPQGDSRSDLIPSSS